MSAGFPIGVWTALLLPAAAMAQLPVLDFAGSASKLSTVTYWDAPYEQQVKLRLTGAEMLPLPGSLFDVKGLVVNRFGTDGKLQAVMESPQCTYALVENEVSSAGPLDVHLGDRVHVEGVGFLWRQNAQSLVISNQVRTVIKMGTWKLSSL
jgi:hypothetical protein